MSNVDLCLLWLQDQVEVENWLQWHLDLFYSTRRL